MWRILALCWAVASIGTVVWFVRLGRLRIKYAVPTLGVGAIVGVLAAVPDVATSISEGLGLETPLGLITLLVLAFASGMSLVAVRELSRLEARSRSLAEAIALLDARTNQIADPRPAASATPQPTDPATSHPTDPATPHPTDPATPHPTDPA
ncbi:MAG: DUF2304 family protein, partial [Microthrixaceae bacterium]|nr:DUF2304 family protein [Microthrixaceae bacterium]